MKDRIKEIRKEQKKTQQAFADSLMVSKSTIESIEYGRHEPTDRMISDICRVYNVNEEWLREGSGDKYNREAQIANLILAIAKNPEDSFIIKMAELLPQLSDKQLEALYNMALMLEKKEDLPF